MPGILPLEYRDLAMAHAVLREVFSNDPEPLPGWLEGDRQKLEMLCACTEVSLFGRHRYETLAEKAAKLFYSAIKTHPFPNGNKRFAFVAVLFLLISNGARFQAAPGAIAEKATWVADSDPHDQATKPEIVIDELTAFFETRIAPTVSPTAS